MINFTLKPTGILLLPLFLLSLSAYSKSIVINQVYGGGGNSGAPFTNDFIELYNNSNVAVNLEGHSIQYASASSSGWSLIALPEATIEPGRFFLIQLSGSTNGEPLPLADFSATLNLSSTSGKVILCSDLNERSGENPLDEGILDKIGYGRANGFEGQEAAPSASNVKAVIRYEAGEDTDDNNLDFYADTPNPRNTNFIITASFSSQEKVNFQTYPNPTYGTFFIDTKNPIVEVSLTSPNGAQETFYSHSINTSLRGLLSLKIKTQESVYFSKIVVH